jgi:O-antigen/teichoic acid export membrane protein
MDSIRKNSIGRNIIHLFIGTVLSRGINAVTLIILAKYLNSYQYGMFSVALAFSMVMGYFTDVGLSNIVLREGAKQGNDIKVIIGSYVKLRIILLIATFLGSFGIIHTIYENNELIRMVYYLIIPMVIGLAMQSIGITYFQLVEQMQYVSIIRILSSILLGVAITIGMILAIPPFQIAFIFGMSYFLAGLYGIYMVHKSIGLTLKLPFQKGLLDQIGLFIISGLVIMLLPHMGPLILENTMPLAQIGLFAVAYRIPSALYQVPGIVGGAFYPVLFKHYSAGRVQEHERLSVLQFKMMVLIAMLLTIPIFHAADIIIAFLFGDNWISAKEPLRILAVLLILQGGGVALADGLTTQGLQGRRTTIQLLTAILGVGLYWILSMLYELKGAVYAALFIELIAMLGFCIMSPNRWRLLKSVLLPYSFLCTVALIGVHRLLGTSSVASILTSIALLSFVLLDVEVRTVMLRYIRKIKKQTAA